MKSPTRPHRRFGPAGSGEVRRDPDGGPLHRPAGHRVSGRLRDPCPAPWQAGRPVGAEGGERVRPRVPERHPEEVPLPPVHLHRHLPAAQFGAGSASAGGVRLPPQADPARHPPALRRAVDPEALPDARDGEAGEGDPEAPRPQPGGPEGRANPLLVQGVHDLDGGARLPVDHHRAGRLPAVHQGAVQGVRRRPEPAGMLDQAARTIGRLRTMASTLLDYEAAESGSILFDIRPFPLSDMLKDCVDFYQPLRGAEKGPVGAGRGFPWRHRPRRPRKGDADPRQPALQRPQVHPFPGDDPPLGKEEDGVAVICVSDSGAGIPKEKLQKIFDQRDMVATLDSHARLGLGLTICKRLVEAQKGKIRIDSAPGKGTQVHFSLPVA